MVCLLAGIIPLPEDAIIDAGLNAAAPPCGGASSYRFFSKSSLQRLTRDTMIQYMPETMAEQLQHAAHKFLQLVSFSTLKIKDALPKILGHPLIPMKQHYISTTSLKRFFEKKGKKITNEELVSIQQAIDHYVFATLQRANSIKGFYA